MIISIFFILLFVAVYAVYHSVRLEQIHQENRLQSAYLMTLTNYYQGIQEQAEAIRCYRHDLANHIQTLEYLIAKQEDSRELKQYITILQKKYQMLLHEKYCDNDVLNALLSSRKQHCQNHNIDFAIDIDTTTVHASAARTINERDLVELLHNLLDNATEACERIPEGMPRSIHLRMVHHSNMYIELTNSISPEESITFKTKKKNSAEHGYGMKIIRDCVKRNHGSYKITVSKDTHQLIQQISLD